MRLLLASLATAAIFVLAVPVTAAQAIEDPRDQDAALAAREAGELMGFGAIRSQVSSRVGGRFLGCDCDPHAARYRMKYLKDGKVVMVDVDARTGNILRISE